MLAREALAGHPPDVRADQLHRAHQGIGEDHGPEQPKAELRASLRISGDPARIVVGRAGDQAGDLVVRGERRGASA